MGAGAPEQHTSGHTSGAARCALIRKRGNTVAIYMQSQYVKGDQVLKRYEILLRWTYKKGEKESTTNRKDALLLRAILDAGFEPLSYCHTYWSSEYHGWWVFKGTNLEAFRANLLQVIQTHKLDKYMTIDITIGGSLSPPFTKLWKGGELVLSDQIEMTAGDKPEFRVEICELKNATAKICPKGKEEQIEIVDYCQLKEKSTVKHTFKPIVVGTGENTVIKILGVPVKGVTSTTTSLTFQVKACEAGEATLFINVNKSDEGPAVQIKVVDPKPAS